MTEVNEYHYLDELLFDIYYQNEGQLYTDGTSLNVPLDRKFSSLAGFSLLALSYHRGLTDTVKKEVSEPFMPYFWEALLERALSRYLMDKRDILFSDFRARIDDALWKKLIKFMKQNYPFLFEEGFFVTPEPVDDGRKKEGNEFDDWMN